MKRRIHFRPIFLTLFYQVVLLLWTGIFFVSVVDLFSIGRPYNIVIAVILVMLDVSLSVSWLLIMQKYAKWRVWYFFVVTTGLGLGNFLVLASLIYWLEKETNINIFFGLSGFTFGVLLMLSAVCLGLYGIWKSYRVKVKSYEVTLKNLPKVWQGKKIVMLADLHLGNIRSFKFINKIVELVQQQKPDLVLIPGDFFDGTPADLAGLAAPLKKIKSKHGIYFCDGNHEEFHHNVPFVHALEKAGVKILNDSFVEIEGLQIIGVGYFSTHGLHKLRDVLESLNFDRDLPSILMKHVPSMFKVAEHNNIGLMLCGHTHMGQVFPFNLLTKLIFKGYSYGFKRYKSLQAIITSGAGTWGPPMRLGSHSEIVSIILK